MKLEVGCSDGILIQNGSCLEVDTSVMQWRKDLENMPKDGSSVFVFSKFAQDFAAVYYSSNGKWLVVNGSYVIFPDDAIHAYCIPTVPEWAGRD